MQDSLGFWYLWIDKYPLMETVVYSAGLAILALTVNQVIMKVLVRGLYQLLKHLSHREPTGFRMIKRLANIAPALVIINGLPAVPHLPQTLVTIVVNVVNGFIILTVAMAISAGLDVVNILYNRRPDACHKPIKGYLQVVKISIYGLATLLVVAVLVDRSPLILFSGLGAMAAVLMLVFQDTLLSLVASVQISTGDMIRVGDWVEVPVLGVNGDVIDIALHTVKIRNFDKTVTTVPIKRFISDAVVNWRGMQESGGRRIKRSVLIDQQSIRFLNDDQIQRLKRFRLMYGYFDIKLDELNQWNQRYIHALAGETADTRQLTNIGTFRVYVERYLRNHPGVHQNMLQIVRQLQPTAQGLPLEVYCFTNTTAWVAYEGIQSDIFDHLLAIAPEFGLRVYQSPSGGDLQAALLLTPPYS